MPDHPQHPKQLPGTKWTATQPVEDFIHWEVARVEGDDVVLRATLDAERQLRLPWRALRDRDAWTPGWR